MIMQWCNKALVIHCNECFHLKFYRICLNIQIYKWNNALFISIQKWQFVFNHINCKIRNVLEYSIDLHQKSLPLYSLKPLQPECKHGLFIKGFSNSISIKNPRGGTGVLAAERLNLLEFFIQTRTCCTHTCCQPLWLKYCRYGVKHYPINQST